MKELELGDLQESIQDKSAFGKLEDYLNLSKTGYDFK